VDERHPLGIPTPTRGGVAEVHAPGRLIRGRRLGLAAYRRRFKTLPHSTGPALSGSSAPLHSSPRAGNATGRGSFKRSRYCQSRSLALAAPELAGPQRKRSRRALGRSGQRAGVRPNVGGGCGDLVPPPFILKCSRSLPVLDRPSLGFYKGRLFRAVFSALLHGCCTKAGPWLGSLSLVLRHPGSAFTRQRSLVRTQHRPLVKCAALQDFRSCSPLSRNACKIALLSLAAFTSVRRCSCGLVYYWCT
jgi:hypothetical protein